MLKVIVNKSVLEANLKICKKVIGTKKDDIKGIELIANKDTDTLLLRVLNAKNYNTCMEINITCEICGTGKLVVDFKELQSAVKNIEVDTFIELKEIDGKLIVFNNKGSRSILDVDADISYDISLSYKNEEFYKIASFEEFSYFKNAFMQAGCAASVDDTKPVLKSIQLKTLKENKIELASIDGYRLAVREIENNHKGIKEGEKFIIPSFVLKVLNIPKNNYINNKPLEIYASNRYIVFVLENITIYTLLIDGEFIEYNKLFNKSTDKFKIKLDARELYKKLKSIKNTCKGRNSIVKIEITDNQILLTNAEKTSCATIEKFEILEKNDYMEGSYNIAFNVNYLMEGIENIKNNMLIKMEFTTNVNPLEIHTFRYKYLVLPVRIVENI